MAPDDVSFHPSRFMIIPNTKRHPKNTKTDQLPTSEVITGLPRPYHNTMIRLCSVAWVRSDALVGQHVVWLRVAKARSVKMYKLATKVYIYGVPGVYILFVPILCLGLAAATASNSYSNRPWNR